MPRPVRAASAADEARQNALLAYYVNNVKQASFFQDGQGLGSEMSEAQVAQLRATYCGLMTEIDDHLGRVFDHLKTTGQWDDTLIVFTCDHGEQLGDHHLLGKIGYCDESYRIPMIVRDPRAEANVTRGTIVERFTETIDTMPTILEWLGLDVPRQCDGRSLLPFCQGTAPADWRTEVHYEFDFRDLHYSKPESALGVAMDKCALAVVQDENFKYVHFAALPPLFFDLEKDPGQFVNRAGDPAYAARMGEYAAKMLTWRLGFAERTLTGYRATPGGLEVRAA
jgi:arylsulfatase A-like enzyme